MIGGRPLVAQAIRVARASGLFASVCVSSDSEEVLNLARAHGADLVFGREGRAADYDAQVKDVCRAVIEQVQAQGHRPLSFAVLLPTSPLRSAADLRAAWQQMEQHSADGCMSLVRYDHPPQRALAISDGYIRSHFGDEFLRPAERLDTLYRHDGSVLFVRTDRFIAHGGFYGLRLVPIVVPRERAVDVDDPLDLAWAEYLVTSGTVSFESLTL